jgi:hypothetical protein
VKANQAPVGTEVVAGLKSEVTRSVVLAGITKVASMLIPGGGFVQALMGAFRSVQFVVQQGQQIMGVITSAVQSVGAIAAGNIGAAVKGVESTLARSIPVALGFLGKVLGLGNIGTKIKTVIGKVRGKLDALLDKAVARIKALIGRSSRPATTSDHDRAVRAGLNDIPAFEAKYTVNGLLPKNAAKRVAQEIQQKHRVFKKVIAHVSQGEHARYEWFASHGWENGAKKLGGRIDVQAELQKARAAAPANWTAVFATGGRKLQCLPDVTGNTSLTLRRTWQESGRSTRSILDRLENAMEKTLLASRPSLSTDRALLETEMEKLAQVVWSETQTLDGAMWRVRRESRSLPNTVQIPGSSPRLIPGSYWRATSNARTAAARFRDSIWAMLCSFQRTAGSSETPATGNRVQSGCPRATLRRNLRSSSVRTA